MPLMQCPYHSAGFLTEHWQCCASVDSAAVDGYQASCRGFLVAAATLTRRSAQAGGAAALICKTALLLTALPDIAGRAPVVLYG